MNDQEEILFYKLKSEVTKTFLQDFPSSNPDISKWKGLDIIYFQEHLRQKTRGNVSEKWFYTYFKSSFEKLPRIDMLNLLAQYCGYKRGWVEFSEIHNSSNLESDILLSPNQELDKESIKRDGLELDNSNKNLLNNKKRDLNKNSPLLNSRIRIFYIALSILFVVIAIIFGVNKYLDYRNTYNFCFYDSDRGSLIKELNIIIEKKGFSPEYYTVNNGCFSYRSSMDTLNMTVSSPMYKKESFIVGLKEIRDRGENNNKNFKLRPDDYAIMLFYYSTASSKDEKKKAQSIKERKEELNKLIADDALIYQVYDSELFGVEVLDKKKYIDFMTTPTTSLKNYVLITSQVNKHNKISLIKFKIQKNEN